MNLQRFSRKRKLSEITSEEAGKHSSPRDETKNLLSMNSKDRTLFGYMRMYAKKDYYDRYKWRAYGLLLLSYLLSLVSCYLSFPYLDVSLTSDVPNLYFRWIAISCLLIIIEVFKHSALHECFKQYFTYRLKPVLPFIVLLLACVFSIYACINGVKESSSIDYAENKPIKEKASKSTLYDSSIISLREANRSLFNKNKYKGKLNAFSEAGKTYAQNELKITELLVKQSKAIEKADSLNELEYGILLDEYKRGHNKRSNFRLYGGYVVELLILFSGGFFLLFAYKSHIEHVVRIESKWELPYMPIAAGESQNAIGFQIKNNVTPVITNTVKDRDCIKGHESVTPAVNPDVTPAVSSTSNLTSVSLLNMNGGKESKGNTGFGSVSCGHCNKKFTKKRANSRYCTGACRQAAYRARKYKS